MFFIREEYQSSLHVWKWTSSHDVFLNLNTRFLPSAEEAEMYKNYKEDPATLVPEDQFMMKVNCFPEYDLPRKIFQLSWNVHKKPFPILHCWAYGFHSVSPATREN